MVVSNSEKSPKINRSTFATQLLRPFPTNPDQTANKHVTTSYKQPTIHLFQNLVTLQKPTLNVNAHQAHSERSTTLVSLKKHVSKENALKTQTHALYVAQTLTETTYSSTLFSNKPLNVAQKLFTQLKTLL